MPRCSFPARAVVGRRQDPKEQVRNEVEADRLVNWTLIIITGVLLSRLLDHLVHDDKLVEVLGFILLPLPVLISWALELFQAEESEDDEHEDENSTDATPDATGTLDHEGAARVPELAFVGAGGASSTSHLADAPAEHENDGFLEAESPRCALSDRTRGTIRGPSRAVEGRGLMEGVAY